MEIPMLNLGGQAPQKQNPPPAVPSLSLGGLSGANQQTTSPVIPTLNLGNSAPVIPSLNLGGSAPNPGPAIPSLNLGGGSTTTVPGIPSLNLSAAPAIPSLNLSAAPAIPSLNLGRQRAPGAPSLGLNLSNLPPASSKNEKHKIIICLPLSTFTDSSELQNLRDQITDTFEPEASLSQLTNFPERWIVESGNSEETAIPTIQMVDSALQEVDSIPLLIDQSNDTYAKLSDEIERNISEIEVLKAKKESLKVQNAVLQEKIKTAQEEKKRFADAAIRVKRDFDIFVEKIGQ